MNQWIQVLIAIVGGLIVGAVASRIVHSFIGSPKRPEPLQKAAKPLASLAMSAGLIAGLIAALGIVQPSALEQLSDDTVRFIPKLISAAIIVIAANVGSSFAETALGTSMARMPFALQRQVQTGVKVAIIALAALLAVGQLGVNTDVINLGVAAIFFGAAASLALLIGLGGQSVARQVASTRAVRRMISVGDFVSIGERYGQVTALLPTAIEVKQSNGELVLVPSVEFINQSISVERAEQESDTE